MKEFSGEAGTIYIQEPADTDDWRFEVWFEDLHMLGKGDSELEALQDAALNTAQTQMLLVKAMSEVTAVAGGES